MAPVSVPTAISVSFEFLANDQMGAEHTCIFFCKSSFFKDRAQRRDEGNEETTYQRIYSMSTVLCHGAVASRAEQSLLTPHHRLQTAVAERNRLQYYRARLAVQTTR